MCGEIFRLFNEGTNKWDLGVEALRPDDPRSCQMDAHFQPR